MGLKKTIGTILKGNGSAQTLERHTGWWAENVNLNINWIFKKEQKPASRNKRKHDRYRVEKEVLFVSGNGLPHNAVIMDASMGGLRIKTREMVRLNTDVGVLLCINGRTAQFLVKIVWEANHNGTFEYGSEFVQSKVNDMSLVSRYVSRLK